MFMQKNENALRKSENHKGREPSWPESPRRIPYGERQPPLKAMPDRTGFIDAGKEISFREMDQITDRVDSGF
jgi:hypothetical protein